MSPELLDELKKLRRDQRKEPRFEQLELPLPPVFPSNFTVTTTPKPKRPLGYSFLVDASACSILNYI